MFGLSGIQAESHICSISNAQTMPCQLQLLLSSSTTCRLAMLPWHNTQPALPDLVTHKRHMCTPPLQMNKGEPRSSYLLLNLLRSKRCQLLPSFTGLLMPH